MLGTTDTLSVSGDDLWTADLLKEVEEPGIEDQQEKEFLYDVNPELMNVLDKTPGKQDSESDSGFSRMKDTIGINSYGQKITKKTRPVMEGLNRIYSDINKEFGSIKEKDMRRAEPVPESDLDSYMEDFMRFDWMDNYVGRKESTRSLLESFESAENYEIETNGIDKDNVLKPEAVKEMEFMDVRRVFDSITLRDYKTVALGYHHGVEDTVDLKNGITKDEYNTRAPVLIEIDHKKDTAYMEAFDPEDDTLALEYKKSEYVTV